MPSLCPESLRFSTESLPCWAHRISGMSVHRPWSQGLHVRLCLDGCRLQQEINFCSIYMSRRYRCTSWRRKGKYLRRNGRRSLALGTPGVGSTWWSDKADQSISTEVMEWWHTETKESIYDCQRPVRTSESSKLESSFPINWTVIVFESDS